MPKNLQNSRERFARDYPTNLPKNVVDDFLGLDSTEQQKIISELKSGHTGTYQLSADSDLNNDKRRAKRLKRLQRLSKVAQLGASAYGADDAAEALGAVSSLSEGASQGDVAGAARKVGSNVAGKQAAKYLNKNKGLIIAKSSALGGAISGALKGEGITGIAGSAYSWWIATIAFGSMFTLAGFIPALLYVDFHWLLNKLGVKFFHRFVGWHRVMFVAANILGVIVLSLAIVLLLIFPVTVYTICNSDSLQGKLAQGALYLSTYGNLDTVCKSVEGFGGFVGTLDNPIPVPPEMCPANLEPPPRFEDLPIDCENCADIAQEGIPIKQENTGDQANIAVVLKLRSMARSNDTFRVTEAFCPYVNHASPNHYNGYAVDINIKPEITPTPELVAELYNDAREAGFKVVKCEYPAGYLNDYGISCEGSALSTGNHIHLEEGNQYN